eukprot:tig00020556_g10980.t1
MPLGPDGVVGIRREDKNKWERRCPLAPHHVKALVARGIKVIIQPSLGRVFRDEEYAEAGAIVQDDLSECNCIFAVKTIPPPLLLPERTYVFFSHTIKAQPENMGMLDVVLRKKIRLIDYETIVDRKGSGQRLVAFGEFAGLAGMIDFFRGLGERFLSLGYSTPFLNVGSSYMYASVADAKEALRAVGKRIAKEGLPRALCPMIFVFTGTGRVSRGAQEIFKLFPHEMVSPLELEDLVRSKKAEAHKLYGCVATQEHMVARKDKPAAAFDKAHYYEKPEAYRPIFHEKVAPWASVIVNCMYWDVRFPRLLTRAQMGRLASEGRSRLVGVCDISCDLNGSVEAVDRYTSIEEPFFLYEPVTQAVQKGTDGDGVLMHAVDHLPSELPRDASLHFGDALLPFVEPLARSDARRPFPDQSDLPPGLREACIAAHGELTPGYAYIAQLRAMDHRASQLHRPSWGPADEVNLARAGDDVAGGVTVHREARAEAVVTLKGHLFDLGVINRTLDAIEQQKAGFELMDIGLGKDCHTPSTAMLRVHAKDDAKLAALLDALKALKLPAEASMVISRPEAAEAPANGVETPEQQPAKGAVRRVLLLGAGMVAAPVVEYLLRSPINLITIASVVLNEAKALAKGRKRTAVAEVDVTSKASLEPLVAGADVVISFVPAMFHVPVAEACIAHKVHMVTASYTSPAMRALDARAKEAGITILNEMGLDPGIDHMSAMQIIADAHRRGAKVESFVSMCGGLPAPEAADNPLGYKFSWNPRGVLTAARNAAKYLDDGRVVEVPGEGLLAAARPADGVSVALALEELPNRDSLPYAQAYGIEAEARTVRRGTLRYRGFGALMGGFARAGLFDDAPRPELAPSAPGALSWPHLLASLLACRPDPKEVRAALAGRALRAEEAPALVACAEWLGLLSESQRVSKRGTPLDAFCALLQERLAYGEGERDLVLLHHEFGIRLPDGSLERKTSTLLAYGEPHGNTAMARTVAFPAAIAAQLIIDGALQRSGVIGPYTEDIYNPVLAALEREGIVCVERTL